MADTKITALTALTGADPANDVIPIVDVNDFTMAASGTTKKISVNNILGSGGTATLASATITGDLTVRTNKLFANATGVGVGTTSVFGDFNVQNSTNARCEIASSATGISYQVYDNARTGFLQSSIYASQHLWFNGVTEAMRLNSTGLGVGGSPATKIFANVTPPGAGQDGVRVSDGTRLIQMSISGSTYSYQGIGANQNVIYAAGNPLSILSDGQNLRLGTSTTSYALLDTSGNVGIGVAPSAGWRAGSRALQLGAARFVSLHEATNGSANLAFAAYESGANAYSYTTTGDAPSRYSLISGRHEWYTAPSGTAGNAITFTQAMTLDASGRLLVGPTSANASGGVLQLSSGITFPATQVASSDANTLDDYEEGTFTPAITGSTTAGTATYVGRSGKYTKIGNLVQVQIFIDYNSHTGTGDTRITGLPFTNAGNFSAATVGYANGLALTAGNYVQAYVDASQSFILLNQAPTGGGSNTTVPIDPAATLVITATYTV